MADTRQLFLDSRMLKVIAAMYPDVMLEAEKSVTPLMNDLLLIKEIHEYTCRSYNPSGNYMHKLLFIAAILRLFNPDALIVDRKLRQGLRDSIAKCLGDGGPNTSYYISQTRAYIKIKSFKSSVALITDGYLNQMSVA